jgi:osmotically-inducible protein OsmY
MDDKSVRQLILEELDFDPTLDSSNIGVGVTKGIVTLTGHVSSYAEKIAAERAVKRIRGVHAVAQEIEVRYPEHKKLADDQIAKRAVDILQWSVRLPEDALKVTVSNGWIRLTGKADWYYQKDMAERALRKLSGVTGITNLITIRAQEPANDVKQRIESALKRNAELEARNIHVVVDEGKVILSGTVKAWHERQLAERAAWAVPGVEQVEDRLIFA